MINKRLVNICVMLVCIAIMQFIVIYCLTTQEPEVVIKEVEVIREIEVIKEVEVIKEIEVQPKTKTVPTNNYDFKSYMPYTAITSRVSKQWELQQNAYTDENGFRCINGLPLVAVGTGWGLSVGDSATVTCDNGNSFKVVIGDIKADIHTLTDNKTTASNNCRCEFIVDMNVLNTTVKRLGNVSVLEQYSGYVIDIKGE